MKTLSDTYRTVSQFHENEKLIARLQSWQVVAWLTPKRRRLILSLGAIIAGAVALLDRHADWKDYLTPATWLPVSLTFPILLGLLYTLYLCAAHFRRLPAPIRRRPQISLHALFWIILGLIWIAPDDGGLGRTVLVLIALSLPYLLWRCGYMLMAGQRGKAAHARFRDHLFYLWPIWDGTNVPAGKGFDYLSQREAQSVEATAKSQLAGIKVFFLSLLMELGKLVMGGIIYGDRKNPLAKLLPGLTLGIPRIKYIIAGALTVSLPTAWLSLYCDLIWETLSIAAKGHLWVGVLRLWGFNVFRNTYKPLLAESIVDFWNRYYYYFKEVLVEFFFFPTYLRYFRTWPRVRMLVAIFAAAFVGNMYYHLLQAKSALVAGELARLWQSLGPRLVYCFLLTVGIYISMLRQQSQRGKVADANPTTAKIRRVIKIAGVWTFFALINFWNVRSGITLPERIQVFLSFFGF